MGWHYGTGGVYRPNLTIRPPGPSVSSLGLTFGQNEQATATVRASARAVAAAAVAVAAAAVSFGGGNPSYAAGTVQKAATASVRAAARTNATASVAAAATASVRAAARTNATASVAAAATASVRAAARTNATAASAVKARGLCSGFSVGTRATGTVTSGVPEQATATVRASSFAIASASAAVASTASVRAGAYASAVSAARRGASASVRAGSFAEATAASSVASGSAVRGSSFAIATGTVTGAPADEQGTATVRAAAFAYALASSTVACAGAPTELDLRLVPKALEILQRLGRTSQFVEPASKTYDPATGVTTFVPGTTYDAVTSPPILVSDKYADGDIVRRGDAKLILAASGLGFVPSLKQRVRFDSSEWAIVEIKTVWASNDVAVFVLQLRGGELISVASTTEQSILDSRLPAVAKRLTRKYGKKVKYYPQSSRVHDPSTGIVTEAGTCEFCVPTVLVKNKREMPRDDVQEYEKIEGILEAEGLGFTPYKSMEASFDGGIWNAIEVRPIYSGGKVAVWRLELRR